MTETRAESVKVGTVLGNKRVLSMRIEGRYVFVATVCLCPRAKVTARTALGVLLAGRALSCGCKRKDQAWMKAARRDIQHLFKPWLDGRPLWDEAKPIEERGKK